MRFVHGKPPPTIRDTHQVVYSMTSAALQRFAVPLVQFSQDEANEVWAPKWAVYLYEELRILYEEGEMWRSSSAVRDIVSYVATSGDEAIIDSVLALWRLGGIDDVRREVTDATMRYDRKIKRMKRIAR